ncbi:MAG: RidA family protein [Planctomycetaceae bacterium]|nr:RidA family protein [Planctomycetaceae bacterium]
MVHAHLLLVVLAPLIASCAASKTFRPVMAPDAPKAIGPYSQAIVSGNYVFCAGQIAIDPATNALVEGGIAPQTERVFDNIQAVLRAEGLTLADVVKTTVFLKNIDDFAAMNDIYAKRFGEHKPARSTVEVAKLPKGALIEIECIAAR